jgi:hypothetical protein
MTALESAKEQMTQARLALDKYTSKPDGDTSSLEYRSLMAALNDNVAYFIRIASLPMVDYVEVQEPRADL